MYEAGPQVLSPVRKPNQVDTVTWDVTREFLHPLASFRSTLSPSLPLAPCLISRPVFPVAKRLPMSIPSRAILRTLRPNNETIFLPIYLPFHRFAFEKVDEHRRRE